MANWYVSSVAYAAIALWTATTAYSAGQIVRPASLQAYGSQRCYRCSTAGTSGSGAPTWPTGRNATVTDGSVTWTECTGQETYQSAGNWKAPYNSIEDPLLALTTGDYVFVSSDHSESQTSSINVKASSSLGQQGYVVSVNRGSGSSLPPVTADITPGAAVAQTSGNMYFGNEIYVEGVNFNFGGSSIQFGTGSYDIIYLKNSIITFTNLNANILIGNGASYQRQDVTWDNVKIAGVAAGYSNQVQNNGGSLTWKNTPINAVTGTGQPGYGFFGDTGTTNYAGPWVLRGLDLSYLTRLTSFFSRLLFDMANCKINASVVLFNATYPQSWGDVAPWKIDNCDDGTDNRNYMMTRVYTCGVVQATATLCRTGGANDGTRGLSWVFTYNNYVLPRVFALRSPPIAKRFSGTLGVSHTATLSFIAFTTTAMTTLQAWMDLEFQGDSGSPCSYSVTSKPDVMPSTTGSTLTSDTSAWDSVAVTRANSTAYTTGQYLKVASNPGRVFRVNGSGTSASSVPSNYATAADGSSFTDGGFTVTCGLRYSISLTFTPQQIGIVTAIFKSTNTAFSLLLDPKLVIV